MTTITARFNQANTHIIPEEATAGRESNKTLDLPDVHQGIKGHRGCGAFWARFVRSAKQIKIGSTKFTVSKQDIGAYLIRTTTSNTAYTTNKKVCIAAYRGFKAYLATLNKESKKSSGVSKKRTLQSVHLKYLAKKGNIANSYVDKRSTQFPFSTPADSQKSRTWHNFFAQEYASGLLY